MYSQLGPKLPTCLQHEVSQTPNDRPLLRLLFEGETATGPFISQVSRELNVDINILQGNIDRFNGITCGVLVIELRASPKLLEAFMQRCQPVNLTVEVLGYVTNDHIIWGYTRHRSNRVYGVNQYIVSDTTWLTPRNITL